MMILRNKQRIHSSFSHYSPNNCRGLSIFCSQNCTVSIFQEGACCAKARDKTLFDTNSLLKWRVRKCPILCKQEKYFFYSSGLSAVVLERLELTNSPHFYCYKCLLRPIKICGKGRRICRRNII